jgi:hypothetical protein
MSAERDAAVEAMLTRIRERVTLAEETFKRDNPLLSGYGGRVAQAGAVEFARIMCELYLETRAELGVVMAARAKLL